MDKLGNFHANKTSMCLDQFFFTYRSKAGLLLWIIFVIYSSFLACLLV